MIKLFVIGATGNVGTELLKQIKNQPDIQLIGTANSRGFTLDPEKDYQPGEVTQIIDFLPPDEKIVVADVSSGDVPLRDFHVELIKKTPHQLITVNKNPVALSRYKNYQLLTKDPARYLYSGTVMAGMGIVPWVAQSTRLGDRVQSVKGAFSGTLSYLTDELSKGILLSDAIQKADEAGYTESDFRDDLNGLDVARKLVIVARDAGWNVSVDDIEIERFLPDEYFQLESAEACLEKVKNEYDAIMAQKYQDAKAQGKTLKYLASMTVKADQVQLRVGFEKIDLDTAFGQLSGTKNRAEVITAFYSKENPYILEGPGAGLEVTAASVLRDLERLKTCSLESSNK